MSKPFAVKTIVSNRVSIQTNDGIASVVLDQANVGNPIVLSTADQARGVMISAGPVGTTRDSLQVAGGNITQFTPDGSNSVQATSATVTAHEVSLLATDGSASVLLDQANVGSPIILETADQDRTLLFSAGPAATTQDAIQIGGGNIFQFTPDGNNVTTSSESITNTSVLTANAVSATVTAHQVSLLATDGSASVFLDQANVGNPIVLETADQARGVMLSAGPVGTTRDSLQVAGGNITQFTPDGSNSVQATSATVTAHQVSLLATDGSASVLLDQTNAGSPIILETANQDRTLLFSAGPAATTQDAIQIGGGNIFQFTPDGNNVTTSSESITNTSVLTANAVSATVTAHQVSLLTTDGSASVLLDQTNVGNPIVLETADQARGVMLSAGPVGTTRDSLQVAGGNIMQFTPDGSNSVQATSATVTAHQVSLLATDGSASVLLDQANAGIPIILETADQARTLLFSAGPAATTQDAIQIGGGNIFQFTPDGNNVTTSSQSIVNTSVFSLDSVNATIGADVDLTQSMITLPPAVLLSPALPTYHELNDTDIPGLNTVSRVNIDPDVGGTTIDSIILAVGSPNPVSREIIVQNVGEVAGKSLTLSNLSPTGTAGGLILCPGLVDYVIPPGGGVIISFDASSNWLIGDR